MSPKSLLIQTNQIHSIIIFSHLDHQLIHRHILHFVTFRHFVLLLSFLAQKKCTPCLISWLTLTGYTLFHCKYYILPALLFRKCISYKRAVIITCYYYNVSILVTCGFQDRKSSVFFYISFRLLPLPRSVFFCCIVLLHMDLYPQYSFSFKSDFY